MEYCIPHYGSTALLRKTVQSVLQTDNHARILIGDDTRKLLTTGWDPSVKVLPGKQRGFAANCNMLVGHCQGEWITLLNNDMVLDRYWWALMKPKLAITSSDIFAIASTILKPDGRIDSQGDSISWYGVGLNLNSGHRVVTSQKKTVPVMGPTGGLAVIRRSIFLHFGGYNETLQSYCEDTFFNLAAVASGYRAVFYPGPRAVHAGSQTHDPATKFYRSSRNTIWYIQAVCVPELAKRLQRRARWYWQMHALITPLYRHEILQGLKDAELDSVSPLSTQLATLVCVAGRESWWQSNRRLAGFVVRKLIH